MKYVIFDNDGIPTPIIFPEWLKHDELASKFQGQFGKPTSAGFMQLDAFPSDVFIKVTGKSVGLDLTTKKEDSQLIEDLLLAETGGGNE